MPEPLLLDRLLLISELFQRDMDREFEGTPLSTARMAVMWTLHHSGPVTQQTLAVALSVSPRNVTALVDALEGAGYVTRGSHPTDRRAHLIDLTRIGREVTERTVLAHAELSGDLLAAVDPDDRAALERGLDAVAARLQQLVAAAETPR